MNEGAPVASEPSKGPRQTVVAKSGQLIASAYRVVRFRGRALIEVMEPYPHFEPLHKDRFEQIAYPLLGGVSRSKMNDIFAYLINTAEDLTPYGDFVLFGKPGEHQVVWDMSSLTVRRDIFPDLCVWRSPYSEVVPDHPDDPIPFIMSLAGGDPGLYDDIMQSMAPLLMDRKPDGVVWWVGDGANGKSTLMNALYRIFPGQLASLTVKMLTDGRDTPRLNAALANVVRESSEGRIDDTQVYKSIGTHEDFTVHKFHSQDTITIRGNMHHIFSANTIPAFNDKGHSVRRRTFIVPFKQTFASDPHFEERTFTPELFGRLIFGMMHYAQRLKQQRFQYKWSIATTGTKIEYDRESNTAEEYIASLIEEGVVAFDSFNPLRMDYENWCADMGYVPLGVGNLRRAAIRGGFSRSSRRTGEHVKKLYKLDHAKSGDLQALSPGRPGLYTVYGLTAIEPEPEKPNPGDDGYKRKVMEKYKW